MAWHPASGPGIFNISSLSTASSLNPISLSSNEGFLLMLSSHLGRRLPTSVLP
jgi:hypothetical protein